MEKFDLVVSKLKGVKRSGKSTIALCPAHDDTKPSLSVSETDSGTVLLHCFAGCETEKILSAVHLEKKDLFIGENHFAAVGQKGVISYEYRDENGNYVWEKRRVGNGKEKKMYSGRFTLDGKWEKTLEGVDTKFLYCLPELIASSDSKVFFTEGEKDVETLRSLGLTATTNGGSTAQWDNSYNKYLRGKRVVVLADNDKAGISKANSVAKSLFGIASSIQIVMLPNLPDGGDVTDWLSAGHTVEELVGIVEATPEWDGEVWTGTDVEQKLKVEIEFLKECLSMSDRGDAMLLARLYEDKYVYDTKIGKWFEFGGVTWYESREVENAVSVDLASQYRYGAILLSANGDDETSQAFMKHATSLGSSRVVDSILRAAETQCGMYMDGNAWDTKTNILAVKNGVIDLDTLELNKANPKDYLLTASATEFIGLDATDENIEQMLSSTFEGEFETLDYLERIIGAAVKGQGNEHIFPILVGNGRNGKDTLLNMISTALGKGYAKDVQKSVVLSSPTSGAASPEIMELRGKRIVWFSETSGDDELNTSLIKKLTGSKDISGRNLYSDIVTFRKTYTIFLMTNEMPKAHDDSEGFWDRVRVIPFKKRFVSEPQKENERKKDAGLEKRLEKVPSALLSWLMRCVEKYNQEGLENIPSSVSLATEGYRNDQNQIMEFVGEVCGVGDDKTCDASELYMRYRSWALTTGQKDTMDGKTFGIKMSKMFTKKRTNKGNVYVGVSV